MNDLKIRTGRRFLALILAFAMVLGVVPTTAFAAKANSVVIEVKDSAGKPVVDAKVTVTFEVKEGEAQTKESENLKNGRIEFVFEGNPKDVTSVGYKVEKKDYVTVTGTTTLGSDKDIVIRKSEITMTVVDAEKKPVASAVATYKINGEGEAKTAEADDAGVIVVDLADTDTEIVGSISAAGYATASIDVENGTSKQIDMPKAQVIFNVKDAQDAAAAGAAVKVTIGDSADAVISTAIDENGSAVVDLSEHAVTADTVISYTIDRDGTNAAKDGFKTVIGTTAAGETVNVKLEKVTHLAEVAVVDADGNALDGVEVTMTVDGNATAKETTKNGVASHTFEIENPENLSFSATVCEVAYSGNAVCGTDNKTEAKLTANQAVTLKVVITGSGTGTVTIGGTQMTNGSSLLVKKDTPIAVTIAAGEKCYSKDLVIPGTDNGDGTYTFAKGGTISVEFVQTYDVKVTVTEGGDAIITGDDVLGFATAVTVDKGTEGLSVYILSDTAYGYEIAAISGVDVIRDQDGNIVENVKGMTELDMRLPAINADMEITISFQLMSYEISLSNNNTFGTATLGGLNEDGTVSHGESVTVTVTPGAYAVFTDIKVMDEDGNVVSYTAEQCALTGNEYELVVENVTGNLAIVVNYDSMGTADLGDNVIVTGVDNDGNTDVLLNSIGNVYVYKAGARVKITPVTSAALRLEKIVGKSSVFYAGSPHTAYETDSFTTGGNPLMGVDYVWNAPIYIIGPKYTVTEGDAVYGVNTGETKTFYRNGATKGGKYRGDQEIVAKIYNYTNAIHGTPGTAYIVDEAWNLIHNGNLLLANNYALKIGRYNNEWNWSSLGSDFGVVFDEIAPVVISVEPDRLPTDDGYYNKNVTLTVTAEDKEEYYSGLASIEYYISTVDSVPTDAVWNIVTMGGEKVGTASIPVDASVYNAENVYVFVRATDMAGNPTTELVETLHINSTPPTLDAVIACEGGHNTYCNCDKRTMTVTVTDRADTINTDDAIEIFWGANGDHEMTLDIEWSDELDEAGNATGNKIGVATHSFTEEAYYSYWAVTYRGKSHTEDKMGSGVFYIDRTPVSEVVIAPGKDENGEEPLNGIYNSTDPIEVTVEAVEPDMKTGIKEVKFEVGYYEGEDFKVTESGVVNGILDEDGKFTGTFQVNPSLNNRCGVVLRVITMDNAGNEDQEETSIDIDISVPVVTVEFSNNNYQNDSYFDAARTATIVVTERMGHVNEENVKLDITAKDAEGNAVELPQLSDWSWDENAKHGDLIDFAATIEFAADANYTFSFTFTDLAGNESEGITYVEGTVAPEAFTVDTLGPTGNLYATAVIVSRDENGAVLDSVTQERGEGWNQLIDPLTFGIWSNDSITVTGIADDITSDIAAVEYYKYNDVVALRYDANEKVLKNGEQVITDWSPISELVKQDVMPENENDPVTHNRGYNVGAYSGNEQFTIYLRITDMAGNVSYISTNGMIVDDKEPTGEQPDNDAETVGEIKIGIPNGNKNGFHTGSVAIGVSVIDPMFTGSAASEDGSFAGLQSVTYELSANDTGMKVIGDLFNSSEPALTEGGSFDSSTGLYYSWAGTVTVDAAVFNSNHVILKIVAVDNAGNVQITTTQDGQIMIDTTAPTIDIKYDNNNPDSGSFYKANRSATITVKERNFDAAAVTAYITKNNEAFAMLDPTNWVPKDGADGGNGDDITHTQTITFDTDGDYTFHIECADLADWTCGNVEGKTYKNEVTFANDTQNPTAFTIDKTLPTISVSYNNNAAQNGKFFNATRTATITVVEHNFDLNRVKITIGTARGGQTPRVNWRDNNDTHVATVTYGVDGDYTFDITMADKAGNANSGVNYGSSVAAKDFVVDTTYTEMVTISGVENGAAYGYGEAVIPEITVSDINLDIYEVSLVGVQKDKTIDLTEDAMKLLKVDGTNVSGLLDLFKMVQELDGIYTLTVTGKDKSGNLDTEEVTFTINRFGSVYAYDEYLSNLITDGGSYVYSVGEDLIITEYNADQLLANSLIVEITRDGKPLENVIYEVTPEINELAKPGTSGWYQYTYTISAENFAADGVYKISVSSKDATGNTPENLNYEDMGITFRVDSTQAEITSIVGLEEPIINASEIDVKYTIFDTIGLKSIKIYVDGVLVDEITDFSADMNNYTGTFQLTESKNAQRVRLVVEDMSGNITDTDAEDFSSAYSFNKSVTVSTNIFVRWYANKALFWGSIVGSIGLAALLWFLLVGKRKKDEESEK